MNNVSNRKFIKIHLTNYKNGHKLENNHKNGDYKFHKTETDE
jgi:hypothetical protein